MSYPVRGPRDPAPRRDRFGRPFGDIFGDPFGQSSRGGAFQADYDVTETADSWELEVRLPGFAPDEVNVELTERELRISARHEDSTESGEGGSQQSRRRSADFSYRLTVPADVAHDNVDARRDHGLLTFKLPRSGASKPRRIEIGQPKRSSIEGTTI